MYFFFLPAPFFIPDAPLFKDQSVEIKASRVDCLGLLDTRGRITGWLRRHSKYSCQKIKFSSFWHGVTQLKRRSTNNSKHRFEMILHSFYVLNCVEVGTLIRFLKIVISLLSSLNVKTLFCPATCLLWKHRYFCQRNGQF